ASGTPDLGRISALEIHADTWDYGGFNLWVDDLKFQAAPPRVQSMAVNGGAAQRSTVTSLQVAFSTVVVLPQNVASAFSLARIGGGAVTIGSTTVATVSGATV